MPELPETETIARDLNRAISGRTIVAVKVTKPDVLREAGKALFMRRLRGATLTRSWRRAKLVVTDLSSGDRLVVQPRFTGALIVDDGTLDPGQLRYSAIAIALDDGRSLHYCDVRRLGTVTLMTQPRFAAYCGGLGQEPLDPTFTAAQLSGVLRGSSQPVKKVLMDQRRIAGIGNIYANEALWRAGVDPSRASRSVTAEEAERLRDDIVAVLQESIAARGTSFRDYRDARGERGAFAEKLQVYGREGQPCQRCGARLIGTHAIDGRATVFCARCQC
ncbi:MAG TPA: bifunctional DNA-formamidopyrimidine glycosylase/DNA-(apurinic or apyrimidinic site) lyase [Gemmatimonadaceae bacterium]|nr:bifunctional DNA-formamidopyrimidine glycosylase/DNA-(apurinic or apyrimidinic site) lyase [Gemmatimonadaceae bacterium]